MNDLGWKVVPLETIADEITVGHVGSMASEYVDHGIPFLRSTNIRRYRVDTGDIRYITPEFHQRLSKSVLSPGDVVLVRTGSPGTASVIPDSLPEANCADLVIVRPSRSVLPGYLAYYINSAAQAHIRSRLVGAVQQHFNVQAAKELPVPLPPMTEQRMIVEVLGALDDKIELNREMNRTLEATAQAIFRSWFVDFDPVVAKADGRKPFRLSEDIAALFPDGFVESDLGAIPAGWMCGSIADIAEYVNGKNFTKNATGTGRMVVRIAELNSGPGGSTVYNEVETDDRHTAYPDDILFAWSGSLDVYRWHRDEAVINQHIFKVICDAYPKWFVYFQVREAMPFFQAIAAGKATTMGHIRRDHLSQAALILPSEGVIDAAARKIEPLYTMIHRNERESQTLATLRDTILPKLLSGEVRVEQAEEAVAANPC